MPRADGGPVVSILVVVHRGADLAAACITSVRKHIECVPYELLVLDSASGDGTPDLLRTQFPDLDLDARADNVGFARGNNLLAAKAQGEHLLLLNPDTELHDDAVHGLLEAAVAHPEAGIVGGRTLRPDGEVDPSSCWGAMTPWSLVCFATGLSTAFSRSALLDPESLGRWPRDTGREVGVVTGCLAMVRTETWRALGGFDESYWMYGEDADLSLRARRAGWRPRITPAATITHHVGGSTATDAAGRKMALVLRSRVTLLQRHWGPVGSRLGVALLMAGVALRAAGAAASGRGGQWRHCWRQRGTWRVGYPKHP